MRSSAQLLFTGFLLAALACSAYCGETNANAAADAAKVGWSKTKPSAGPSVETANGFMVPYTMQIPGTEIQFEMVPIPGGKFRMGSPDAEADRTDDEGPQFEVAVEPFWMGKHEVTWSEYQIFMDLYESFKELESLRTRLQSDDADEKSKVAEMVKKYDVLRRRIEGKVEDADAVTAPTRLYEPEITYQYGDQPRQPAVTMTQFAAKHYTKWLSKTTGQFYRLPTESEWEYACRAGAATAYSFGDDPSQLGDYAWFADNADGELHEVGTKKPNAWGLFDMHGSVAEWVLDELLADGYKKFAGKSLKSGEAVVWPTRLYPRVVRGGHWDSAAAACRCASRLGSQDEDWKDYDPNLPLSPWWFTTEPAHGVGFRIVRPVGAPTPEELVKVWEADVDDVKFDVDSRLDEGRGAKEGVDLELPVAIQQLKELKKDAP